MLALFFAAPAIYIGPPVERLEEGYQLFSVVCFSRGALPKKRVKGHYWGTLIWMSVFLGWTPPPPKCLVFVWFLLNNHQKRVPQKWVCRFLRVPVPLLGDFKGKPKGKPPILGFPGKTTGPNCRNQASAANLDRRFVASRLGDHSRCLCVP